MLKKMQRRFILAAMAAFGAVMVVLLIGINVAYYFQATSVQDSMARSLLDYERRALDKQKLPRRPMDDVPGNEQPPLPAPEKEQPPFPMPGNPEAAFMTRFFAVHCDASGNVRSVFREFISSVDEETAGDYADAVLGKGRARGYYGDYRYLVSRDRAGVTVLFLNAANTLQNIRTLFFVSLTIGVASLAVVFLLILLLSGYAIRPFAKNLEQQKRFITDAGHELKTPITSIATSADIASMEHEGDEWIENIRKQTARLSRLVSDLVALSRLDEEAPFPEKRNFSLSEAAWETAEPFAVQAKAMGKEYRQKVEENLTLYGDRDAIQRMLSILLDNAVKYSGEGGEIQLDVYRRHGKTCIEVLNTCELPKLPDLDRLFDRFYRVDESRSTRTGGTGIGLSMARAIAESHGGKIEAKAVEGSAIRFKVVL